MYWRSVASISPDLARTPDSFAAGAAAARAPLVERLSGSGPLERPRNAHWPRAWLTVRVHGDAFRFDPVGYLQAVLWRVRGLRLRSRNRIAALIGRSPHAYALWLARKEPRARAAQPRIQITGASSILPLIDCREGSDGIQRTLESLAEAGSHVGAVAIGGEPAGIPRVDHPSELARLIDAPEAWACLLHPGDVLAPGALSIYAAAIAQSQESCVIYADDDQIGPDGTRSAPHFKPNWNPELFEHHDFVTGAAILHVRREALPELSMPGWTEALVNGALNRGSAPVHLPLILHHRRYRPKPIVPATPADPLPNPAPSVTVIIPTRNRAALLRNCIGGLRRTAYPGVETIIVDNGSDDPDTLTYLQALEDEGTTVVHIPGPFNYSGLNNEAVRHASGELLCFLNNDVEMIGADWLALLVRQAARPELGAVGARLLYPDGTVQHAGVFTGIGGGAAHGHRFQRQDEPGYFERARLPQRVSAVTGACLVVERKKFLAVGGFDEREFPVAFNDVDLCLKLNESGWHSFYEPRATLIHHESKSRGSDAAKSNRARFAGELAALKRKWHTDERTDPYHHPQLSPFCEQFLIGL